MQAAQPDANVQDLMAAAGRALAAGDPATARRSLREIVTREPGNVAAWLNLAAAARAMSDLSAAMQALEGALRAEPRNFFALLGKASLLERQGHGKAAATAYGIALSLAPPDERLDPGTLRAVQHGRELHQRHNVELEDFIRDALAGTLAQGGASAERRATAFIDVSLRKRPTFRQEPVEFFYPGLPAIEFYEREMFPWLEALEAATDDIHAELLTVLEEDAASLEPYVAYPDNVPLDQWAELNHSTRWTGYHMLKDGKPVEENCRRVPRTMEAIGVIDQPQVPRRSPAAMFSVLEPRTRIPPHTGISNTRLVLHLPLIIPPDCGFRVGSETREWRRGEAWVFDDTINHEAWNLSDERRVIMICDVWSPFLNELDRQIVAETMNAMDVFNEVAPNSDL